MDRPRRKGKQARNVNVDQSAMSNLPNHILIDIISRLPIKAVMIIRCVCKSLLSLVSEPYFKELYSTRAPTELFVRNLDQEDSSLSTTLYITEPVFSDDSCIPVDIKFRAVFDIQRFSVRHTNTLNFRAFKNTKLSFVNSCYGLACYTANRFAIICNPITGEFVTFPPPQLRDWSVDYGLGFFHDRFKLLRVRSYYDTKTHVLSMFCEIYTFGESGSWKKVASRTDDPLCGAPIFFERVLIWYVSDYVVTFDFDTEQFGKHVTPWDHEMSVRMSVVGGCLYAHSRKDTSGIWVMKQYGQGSWVKVFSIQISQPWYMNRRYELIKHLGNGEILMREDSSALVCYNPDTRRVIRTIGYIFRGYEGVSIRPSLLSLKVMLGDDVKVHNVESWSAHKDRVEVATVPGWWTNKNELDSLRKVNDTSDSVPFTN